MLTAGAGLNFLHLIVEFAGEASPTKVATQTQGSSTKIPSELGASVSLSILFGGSEEERHHPKPEPDLQPAPQPVPVQKAPAAPTTAPAKASNTVPPAQADQIRKNAAQSQKELNQQAMPAPANTTTPAGQ